jgi:hypothetical protein
MTRSRITNSRLEEVFCELKADDRAAAYLCRLPQDVATVIAVRTAVELASIWEIEKRRLSRINDPRLVYHIGVEDRQVLYLAAAEHSCNPLWSQYSDDTYSELFSKLPPDVAAEVAFIGARRMARL